MITDNIDEEQLRLMQNQNLSLRNQQEMMIDDRERSMVKDQLDLSEEIERIEHLLRGHVLKEDGQGNRNWVEPDNNEMVVLSEYGIHLILNTITWYINKNTLLSNYDDETILTKMEDFACDLSDTIFMEYEKIFQYPSFEDCKKILEQRIEYKVKVKMFALETLGKKSDRAEVKRELMNEIENRIDVEIQKIKEQIIKNKLKRFLILLRCIQDSVHSTYLRAYKGQERRTLREHIHITETMGGYSNRPQQQQQGSGWSPLNWFQKRQS